MEEHWAMGKWTTTPDKKFPLPCFFLTFPKSFPNTFSYLGNHKKEGWKNSGKSEWITCYRLTSFLEK